MFLLDTNIVSELVKRAPEPKLVARLNQEKQSDLFISVITIFELRYGAARSAKPASLWARIDRDIVSRFQTLPFNEQDSLAAADLLATLAGGGHNLGLQDVFLAGAAFSRGFTLVTRNRRDFDRIIGLQIENWFE